MVIIRQNIYTLEKDISVEGIDSNIKSAETDGYGAAVDIGTTTIAVGLFSLNTKKHLANITETNLQTRYGADVMMRIMHANMGKAAILHELVVSQIEDMLERASEGICAVHDIKELAVVGNTTMCHLFLDKDLSRMAGTPFTPAYKGSISIFGKDIGFKKYSHLSIYVLPNIAAHIGADAVSVLCSEKLYKSDKIQLAIDIGTSAEILLNNKGKIYACSAAAGPAFEGKSVRCGMKAANGAINGIKISKTTGNIILDVIKQDTPIGICGSGFVDAIAELLKAKVLRENGYLIEYDEAIKNKVNASIAKRLGKNDDGNFFVFYNSLKGDIVLTQKDIRSIQLAKAAIQAGTEILLKKADISLESVNEIKIAGVFGKFIHPKSAIAFGLYPNVDNSRIEFIGNAAGRGAAMALLDKNFRNMAEKYIDKVDHIELADEDAFKSKFLGAMELKKW